MIEALVLFCILLILIRLAGRSWHGSDSEMQLAGVVDARELIATRIG